MIKRLFRLTTVGGTASLGAFFWTTRRDIFVPMPLSDSIFHGKAFEKFNPSHNPTTHDLCIRRVPLSDINPALLEKKGKLVEAFCAGIWSGWGYAFQRAYLALKYQSPETASHLWSSTELRTSTYELGTLITNHIEVIEKTPERILGRLGDSPRVRGLRPFDGLFEMSAILKPDEGVVEFGLKSCLFQGLGRAKGPPMPPPIAWLHRQYTKLLSATAVSMVLR